MGIVCVWCFVLVEWVKIEFVNYIILFDRVNIVKVLGIRYRVLLVYSYNNIDVDK